MPTDGLWTPIEPDWLRERVNDETQFLQSIRPIEPVTTPPNSLLAAALVKARSEITAIPKDSVNPHFKSRYASLDTIIELVVPILNSHGLTVVQGVISPDRDETGKVTSFTVTTMLLHTSGESLMTAVVMPVAKSDPQGAGAALTYGRRYGLSLFLGLATDDDDDGNAASKPKAAATQRRNSAEAPPQTFTTGATPEDRKVKGKRLGDMDELELIGLLEWAKKQEPARVKSLITDVEAVLDARRVAQDVA